MGGCNKLNSWKVSSKVPADLALPVGVKVKVDFVDDNDSRFAEGIWTVGELLDQSPGDVRRPGEYSLTTKA